MRPVLIQDGRDDPRVNWDKHVIPRSCLQRKVNIISPSIIAADFADRARAGIVWVLVSGNEQYMRAVIETGLGAVAVMDVEVDYCYSVEPADAQEERGGDRHVVKQTEAHCPVGTGMVPGRADKSKGAIYLAAADRVDAREHASCSQHRGIIASGRNPGVRIKAARRLKAGLADALDMLRAVDQCKFLDTGRAGLDPMPTIGDARAVDRLLYVCQAPG